MKTILIDMGLCFVRIAYVVDGTLTELVVEDQNHRSHVGNIYVGKVKNILPSQFAFIDIGLKQNGFLFLNDNKESGLYDTRENEKSKLKMKQNDDLLVQVLKDDTGSKGPVLTTQISVTGKYVVLFKSLDQYSSIGLSRKIDSEKKREELTQLFQEILPPGYSIIVRTQCQWAEAKEIMEDFWQCREQCDTLVEKAKYMKGPAVVYQEETLFGKALKELLVGDIDEIIVNAPQVYDKIYAFLQKEFPYFAPKLACYNEAVSLFDAYGMEKQIQKLLLPKVWLPSGGFLMIQETEACVVIDVNSGKFSGKKGHEETALKINLEAVREIAFQLRLRNLSGIIIIDFIDMKDGTNQKLLKETVEKAIKKDRIPASIVDVTRLGLMVLTRKKSREPLSRILTRECHMCHGTGREPVAGAVADEILRKVNTMMAQTIYNRITVVAHEMVIQRLEKSKGGMACNLVFVPLKQVSVGFYELKPERVFE